MFPLSGAPLSGAGGSGGPQNFFVSLTENVQFSSLAAAFASVIVEDGMQFEDVSAGELIMVIVERLMLTGTALPSTAHFGRLTDAVRFDTAMQLGWMIAVNEGITLSGSAAGQRTTVAVITDILHAVGAVNTTLDARVIISTVIALSSMIAAGWKVELSETVEFQDALNAQLTAVTKLVDTASFADTVGPSLRMVALASDSVDFGDDAFPSSEMFERLAEEVVFYTTIRLGDTEYTGWALNEGAVTEYNNYPFNGFIEFDGRYFATSQTSGLCEIGGKTDDGDAIEWSIKTALMDFATGKLKRIPDCYFSIAGSGDVFLKVITTEQDGLRHTNVYKATLRPGPGEALHNERIKVGRGISARYYQFELSGSGPMEIDEMAWRPLVLDRRL